MKQIDPVGLTESTVEDFPDGWPRLAAFMESSESFGIYRMFGVPHARLLVIHMSNIEEIWTELLEMDRKDAAGGANTNWRLKNRFHEDGLDTSKIVLQQRLEAEILAYGIVRFPSFTQNTGSLAATPRYPIGKVRKYQVDEPDTSTGP